MVGRAAMSRLPGLAAIKPLPLERILNGGLEGLKRDEVESFYGRSWLLTHYLTFAKPRAGQLQSFLAAIAKGTSFAEASKLFGDLKALDKEITYYFKDGAYPYRILHLPIPDPGAVVVRDLSPAESALAIERLQYVSGIDPGTADEYAAKVEAVAKQYPSDPFALQLLSAARFAIQDFAGAEKAADALIAVAPNNSRAMLAKGMARVRLVSEMDNPEPSDWKEARRWIVKANRADENDPLAYVEYYTSFVEARERPPELALEGLMRALELAPQDQGLRMNTAIQLASAGHFERATSMIKPLAFSPHQSSFSRTARYFFDSFEKNKMPSSPPPQADEPNQAGSSPVS
jgi:tetratricopeptide (TPR) repeat protein